MTTRRCDDDGACHHACRAGKCFRREFAAPLSATGCETWEEFDAKAAAVCAFSSDWGDRCQRQPHRGAFCFKHATHGAASCSRDCGGISGHPGPHDPEIRKDMEFMGAQATPLTRDQVEACRRIGRDVAANNTTIGLPELDALCDTALLGIGAIERLAAGNAHHRYCNVCDAQTAPGVPHVCGLARAPRDPDRPCEKEHPELEKLCGALRSLGVPCDGFTPAADAEGALRGALSRAELAEKIGPCRALLTDYLSGRFIPGMGPDSIDTVESLCRAALAALKHVDASARVVDTRNPPR